MHVLAKGFNSKDKKWKMEKEIENILNTRVANPITGINFLKVEGSANLPEEDVRSDVAHSKYTVLLYYPKIAS